MYFDNLPRKGFICAHRGARSLAPENTLLAMDTARTCGAHCWETDVRLSRDGDLIIFHDPTLARTTDIADHTAFTAQSPWPTSHFSTAVLRSLDAGSWFAAADPFGTINSGEVGPQELKKMAGLKIPLLHEVLEYTRRYRFPVNLEIKDVGTTPGDIHTVDMIIEMIEQTATADLVLLSSFQYAYLHRARQLHPTVSLAMLAEQEHPVDLVNMLRKISAVAYHPDARLCDTALVRELQQTGIRLTPWTVNYIDQAQQMLKAGLGVVTDWPQRLTGKQK